MATKATTEEQGKDKSAAQSDQARVRWNTTGLKSSYCNVANATSTREEVVLKAMKLTRASAKSIMLMMVKARRIAQLSPSSAFDDASRPPAAGGRGTQASVVYPRKRELRTARANPNVLHAKRPMGHWPGGGWLLV